MDLISQPALSKRIKQTFLFFFSFLGTLQNVTYLAFCCEISFEQAIDLKMQIVVAEV